MKIAFGMIVFEGDYVLKQCLEQIYDHASQILISEGPVKYWQNLGKKTSEDETNKILNEFPDPENKIKVIHGQFEEKDDQSNAYMKYINDDIDYIWMIDSDEIYKKEDIEKTIKFLEQHQPTSVGVRSISFYGGFDRYLTGFELNTDNFLRIFKYEPDCDWLAHRPPTINYRGKIETKHINSDLFYSMTGVQMYHYSYVFPDQVFKKVSYYKAAVSRNLCIDNYFYSIYFPWVTGDNQRKSEIENAYNGVHEFQPYHRGECRTEKFELQHPEAIIKDLEILTKKFHDQLKKYYMTTQ